MRDEKKINNIFKFPYKLELFRSVIWFRNFEYFDHDTFCS